MLIISVLLLHFGHYITVYYLCIVTYALFRSCVTGSVIVNRKYSVVCSTTLLVKMMDTMKKPDRPFWVNWVRRVPLVSVMWNGQCRCEKILIPVLSHYCLLWLHYDITAFTVTCFCSCTVTPLCLLSLYCHITVFIALFRLCDITVRIIPRVVSIWGTEVAFSPGNWWLHGPNTSFAT